MGRQTIRYTVLALLLAAGSTTAITLHQLPPTTVEQWQLAARQGRQPALWQLWAAAYLGNRHAQWVVGDYLVSQRPRQAEGSAWLRRAAQQGEGHAALRLGELALAGTLDGGADYPQARHWFKQAAATQASAHYQLALLYKNGRGGPADAELALAELQQAAAGGVAQARFLLANAYLNGDGVPRDEAQAIQLLQQAASAGHPAAMQALALAYQRGDLGLPQDPQRAANYFSAAAEAIEDGPRLH